MAKSDALVVARNRIGSRTKAKMMLETEDGNEDKVELGPVPLTSTPAIFVAAAAVYRQKPIAVNWKVRRGM